MPIKKIQVKNLTQTFGFSLSQRKPILDNVNIDFVPGKVTAIIGPSPAGKTVLLQHLNGLIWPTKGKILIDDFVLSTKKKSRKQLPQLRKKIGFLFQFPEQQLFEETVKKDVYFAPRNFGINKKIIQKNQKKYFQLLDIPDTYLNKSPFQLSGGEKRKVAIAGIFTYDPEIILVDEMVRGLDIETQNNFTKFLKNLNHKYSKTIIFTTNNMECVLEMADYVVIMKDGQVQETTTPQKLFFDSIKCKKYDIYVPKTIHFLQNLKKQGFNIKEIDFKTEKNLIDSLVASLQKHKKK